MRHALLHSLALALLALGAHPQTKATQSAPTPRTLLERGALAEEQQRDFAGAQKLYEQAEAAANAAGDTKTAAEASAAKERVLARQGAATPGRAKADDALQAQLKQRARDVLSGLHSVSDSLNARNNAGQLIDLGPGIADMLEAALHGTGGLTSDVASPFVAAAALAGMDTVDTDRRLVQAYESPDPIVRKAIIGAATAPRFVELNLRAANDAVASIRGEATHMLLRSTDARAGAFIAKRARDGWGQAVDWLARHDPQGCLSLAEDTALDADVRANALQHLSKPDGARLAPLLPRLARLVRLNAATSKELAELAGDAASGASRLEGAQRDALLPELERELLGVESVEFDTWAIGILEENGSDRMEDAFRAAFERRRSTERPTRLDDLIYYSGVLVGERVDTAQFERWALLALAAPSNWPTVKMSSRAAMFEEFLLDHLSSTSGPAQLAAWTALWPRVPETHRPAYARAFLQLLRKLFEGGSEFALPSDATPVLRFALERSIEPSGWNPLGGVLTRFERYDLLDAVAAAPRKSMNSALAASVLELGKRNPDAVLNALRGGLSAIAARPGAVDDHRVSWLLSAAPQASAVKFWRETWKDAGPDMRCTMLTVLVERDFPAERDALLVEMYPQIEALIPGLRPAALQRFGSALVEAALPILEREIRSPDLGVRIAAMEVADEFRKHREAVAEFEAWRKAVTVEEGTIAELAKLLENRNGDVVIGAVKALGILRARPALPALVKLLERDDKELKAAVQAAIDTIGG